jgi:hypothetical protein
VHVLLLALALHGAVAPVSRAELGASWRSGCPVAPAQLRELRVPYWGFDGKRHVGALVVNERVVGQVSAIFGRLYRERFPIRRMTPIAAYGGSDDRSMAADNTSGFNCRYAVAPGPKHWSAHAYGEAIDVNPVENPYREDGRVLPPAGRAYVDRSKARPGMAVTGRTLVTAFIAGGWQWGGRWTGSPDYQHFSSTGG